MRKYDYVIILASGDGDRVSKYTYSNSIPKILMSIGNETILSSIMDTLDEVSSNGAFITLRESHIEPVNDIIYSQEKSQEIVTIPDSGRYGTAYSLHCALKHIYECYGFKKDANVLVIWSDILEYHSESLRPFNEMISLFNDATDVVIGTDKNPRHRYGYKNGIISESKSNKGNVAGCYAFKSISSIKFVLDHKYGIYSDGNFQNNLIKKLDLIDIIKETYEKESFATNMDFDFIDIGDEEKYKKFMSPERTKTRYFNELEIADFVVEKRALSKTGQEVIQNEIDYLQFAEYVGVQDMFVNVLDYKKDGYSMERLDSTIHESINASGQASYYKKVSIMHDFLEFIKPLHELDHYTLPENCGYDSEMQDFVKYEYLENEYLNVTKQRYYKIQNIIKSVDVKRFNGVPIPDFEYMMLRVEDFLKGYASSSRFSMIHGDTNTNNVMYDSDGRMKLIDPRGTFGGLKYFGDVNYDIAKFIYSLGGYADFNADDNFTAMIIGDNLCASKKTVDYLDFDRILSAVERYDRDEIGVIISLIWLKLPFYIINNPTKAIYAYYYGINRLDYYLRQNGC